MQKLVLLVISLALFSSLVAGQCYANQTCVTTLGNTCDNVGYQTCMSGTYCNDTDTSSMNGVCVAAAAIGQPCASLFDSESCASGLCLPDGDGNNVCRDGFAYPGQACTMDSDCIYLGFTSAYKITANSTCQSGTCFGNAANATCAGINPANCVPGYYCNTAVFGSYACQPLLSNGADCTTDTTCASGACIPSAAGSFGQYTGSCGNLFSQTSGGLCNSNNHCADGYFCSNLFGTGLGNCTANIASSNTACTDQSSCSNQYELCDCSSTGSSTCQFESGNPTGNAAAYNTYLTCKNANARCNFDPYCSACSTQFCSYFKIETGYSTAPSYINPTTFLCTLSASEQAFYSGCFLSNPTSAPTTPGSTNGGSVTGGTNAATAGSGTTGATTSAAHGLFAPLALLIVFVFLLIVQ